jgi:hypothetical protein
MADTGASPTSVALKSLSPQRLGMRIQIGGKIGNFSAIVD